MKEKPRMFMLAIGHDSENSFIDLALDICKHVARKDPSYAKIFPHLLEKCVEYGYHCTYRIFDLCKITASLRLLRNGDMGKMMYLAGKISFPVEQRNKIKKMF